MQLLKSYSKWHWHLMWYLKGISHPKFMAINQVHGFRKTALTMEFLKAANSITQLGAQRLQSRQSNQAIILQPRVQKESLPSTLHFQNSLSWKAVSGPEKAMPPHLWLWKPFLNSTIYSPGPLVTESKIEGTQIKKSAFAVLRQTKSILFSSGVLILTIPETP